MCYPDTFDWVSVAPAMMAEAAGLLTPLEAVVGRHWLRHTLNAGLMPRGASDKQLPTTKPLHCQRADLIARLLGQIASTNHPGYNAMDRVALPRTVGVSLRHSKINDSAAERRKI